MTYILGLTGGIASGKSTVSQHFTAMGVDVIDADVVAKEVVEPRTPGLARVVAHFGSKILTETGELDRKRLGDIIFNDKQKREDLNAILHGEIGEVIEKRKNALIEQGKELIVLDIPLLFEADYESQCDEVMTVFVSKDVQVKRLMLRDGIDETLALAKIDSQMSLIDKALKSDVIIDNEGSVKNTELQVDRWLEIFKQTR
ncbi:dephospho-CoA kinase [Vagococcus sp. DIV0080]|uniref:Dephospho-CoA kinase n=1 Tax=Candidatus Vagococcus giribetii TaxID=2230876 RepID=A0ABS3HVW3_9ENTE|nr:dephospho-CoA kinase [Vagococcus sp. DIV0080]MBO0477288.1 dephospho-CoA kinase [Vagococcus sp. DIV0080]